MRDSITRLPKARGVEQQCSEMPPALRPVRSKFGGAFVQTDGLRYAIGIHRGARAFRQFLERLGIRTAPRVLSFG